MIELINNNPQKMVLFFVLFLVGIVFFATNIRNPQRIYFALVFYIPLSFRSLSGSLSMYMILLFFLFVTFSQLKFDSGPQYSSGDTIIVVSILLLSGLSLLQLPPVFYHDYGRFRLSGDYLSFITMISCLGIYQMTKRFIISIEDLIKLLKVLVVSGSIASIAGYLQLISPSNTYLFKYIVVAENIKWSTRLAATMPGYELLSEYTILLILFTIILILYSNNLKEKLTYSVLLLNFLIILPLTQTRGIYAAVAVGMVYLILLMFFLGRIGTSMKAFAYSSIVIVFLVGTIFIIDIVRPNSQFVERLKPENININISEGKFDTRTPAWLYGIKLVNESSLFERLTGSGYKYFGKRAGVMKLTGWPHSLYLSYLIRDGILGLFALLTFFAWLYLKSIQTILLSKGFQNDFWFKVSTIVHIGFIIFIVNEAKIEFIRHDRTQNITWLFFAIIVVLHSICKQKSVARTDVSTLNQATPKATT